MAIPEHLELVRRGSAAIAEWRRDDRFRHIDLRGACLTGIDLANVDLSGADLRGADFTRAKLDNADLSSAALTEAILDGASLFGARFGYGGLEKASLRGAKLSYADFNIAAVQEADLTGADLSCARLDQVGLQGAVLREANLSSACMHEVDFENADLTGAELSSAHFHHVRLPRTNLSNANVGWTVFADGDFSTVTGLDTVTHAGPSYIAQSVLRESRGQIHDTFLRGCGFADWEILNYRLYDTGLAAAQISELQYRVFDARAKGLFMRRAFVSYAHEDSCFVDELNSRLFDEAIITWLDRHDAVAGSLQRQINRAIRDNDLVILVLSKHAVESDWLENELELARKKEKEEGRDVLCPVALDSSWKRMLGDEARGRQLWRKLAQMLVIDFSQWQATDGFEEPFRKLVRGLAINYEQKAK